MGVEGAEPLAGSGAGAPAGVWGRRPQWGYGGEAPEAQKNTRVLNIFLNLKLY